MKVLAFDFGASSGRALLGEFNNGKINYTEIHRFANEPVKINETLYWDILRLFHEIKQSIIKCVALGHSDIESISIDTWGVDYVLLDEKGFMLDNPVHYRDNRTKKIINEVLSIIDKKEMYQKTGIQFLDFNTIFQLYALKKNRPKLLEQAKTLLFIPDFIAYLLTGEISCEYTVASTSGLVNCFTRDWDKELINKLKLPEKIFPKIKQPGEILGKLKKELAEELGIKQVKVVLACSHDTASAVLATPLNEKSIFISCGTWSLLGRELNKPIISDVAFKANYTNEGGYNNTIRFLKNITGLWILQEVVRDFEKQGEKISYSDLNEKIRHIVNNSFINPDYEEFLTHGNMINKIKNYLELTKQSKLLSLEEIALCIYESLALTYKNKIDLLEKVTKEKIDSIYIVGGGAKSKNLCQFTANATKKIIYSGPIEATALGNIIIQLIANKQIKSIKEAREIIKNNMDIKIFYPENTNIWEQKYQRYLSLI